jgi:hypothetical protein
MHHLEMDWGVVTVNRHRHDGNYDYKNKNGEKYLRK